VHAASVQVPYVILVVHIKSTSRQIVQTARANGAHGVDALTVRSWSTRMAVQAASRSALTPLRPQLQSSTTWSGLIAITMRRRCSFAQLIFSGQPHGVVAKSPPPTTIILVETV